MAVTPGARPPGARWWLGVLAWGLWALVMLGLATLPWLDQLLRRAGRPDLVGLNADAVPYLLALVSAATVGAVLASRRPRHPVGWLLLALGLSVIALGVCQAYASYGLLARPGTLPAARWAAVYADASWIPLSALIGFVLLLTPTGSLPSPRWRWWARVVVAAAVVTAALRPETLDGPFEAVDNPLAVHSGPLEVVATLGDLITLLAVVVAGGSLVVRFRRARGTERQQLRWVALAAALAVVAVAVILVSWALLGAEAQALWGWATGLYVAILPLATGAAVLRYRLYDLDRIVSRTLAYGLLTVVLGLGYAAVVLGLGRLLPQDSSLAVAGATLAVAAMFQPARQRIQQAVDRRFNRRRYDAARTLQGFSARLREEVDLDTLTAELLAVVDQTMQPTQVSLWLRPSPAASRATAAVQRPSDPLGLTTAG
jgi:hypothetical protein